METAQRKRVLTLREKFQLLVHLIVCEFCRRFLEQTKIISREARSVVSAEGLTDDEKRKMPEALDLI